MRNRFDTTPGPLLGATMRGAAATSTSATRQTARAAHAGPTISRREALRLGALGAMALASGACLGTTDPTEASGTGRLDVQVRGPDLITEPGLYQLGLSTSSRDGLLYVPTSYAPNTAAPLALLLHGAGQEASELVTPMRPLADTLGLVLVAPDSRAGTWDGVYGAYGVDVEFIRKALGLAFSRVRVDPARVRIAGFSDGATYSLSLGLLNGDLFSRVVAFSPGFIIGGGKAVGKPKFFITHGTNDMVLPIDQTSRVIVPQLRDAGYDVQYFEFPGKHGVSEELFTAATNWLGEP